MLPPGRKSLIFPLKWRIAVHRDTDIEMLTHNHQIIGDKHDQSERRALFVVGLTAIMMVGETNLDGDPESPERI